MNLIRRPFMVATLILVAAAFAVEAGSRLWVFRAAKSAVSAAGVSRPGLGIPSLAALDALLLLTAVVIALVGMGVPARIVGRIQGIATVIVSFFGCLGSIVLLFTTFGLLMLMVGLLLSVPFGTAVYLALFGDFPRGTAAATLGFLMILKLVAAFCLVLASLQVLKSKSIVLLFLCSIGLTFLLAFLHAFVPGPLVSIADAIGALIAFIVAILWALYYLIGGILSIVKNLMVGRLTGKTVTSR
ncbi:MAG TPA: hypothetical protein VFU23_02950 [Gemmatimonadales bacterium]|nr:hypothetical protein [Gemmatimonadales bacterium]